MIRAETQVSWLTFLCSLDTNGRTSRIILRHLFGFYLLMCSVRLSSSNLPPGLLPRVNPLECWFLTLVNSWSRSKGLWPNRFNAVFKRLSSFYFCTAFSMLCVFSISKRKMQNVIFPLLFVQNFLSPPFKPCKERAFQGHSLWNTLKAV